jgi:hypothetical protein
MVIHTERRWRRRRRSTGVLKTLLAATGGLISLSGLCPSRLLGWSQTLENLAPEARTRVEQIAPAFC